MDAYLVTHLWCGVTEPIAIFSFEADAHNYVLARHDELKNRRDRDDHLWGVAQIPLNPPMTGEIEMQDDNDTVTIILKREDWTKFQETINKLPPEPNAKLKRLMAISAPWDTPAE